MKVTEYDLRIIKTVKALRILKREKQLNVARVLGMEESNYCKIEQGQRPLSIVELRTIANYFGTSYFQILLMAEEDISSSFKSNPLSKLILEHIWMLGERGEKAGYTKEEINALIDQIRKFYDKTQNFPFRKVI
jgi:transcriptional regulator with XRE-family HTH domain